MGRNSFTVMLRRCLTIYLREYIAWFGVSAVDKVSEIHKSRTSGFDLSYPQDTIAANYIEILIDGSGWQIFTFCGFAYLSYCDGYSLGFAGLF